MTPINYLYADSRNVHNVKLTRMLAFVPVMLALLAVSACMHEPELDASRSTEPVAPGPDAEAIRVMIDPNSDIWIDGEVVDPQITRTRIEDLHTANPDWPLVISADQSSSNSVVITVLDAAKMSGVRSIAIVSAE